MEEDDIVHEIESAYSERTAPAALSERVHRSVLLASVLQAVVKLYVSSAALLARSALEVFGGGPTASTDEKELRR